MGKHTPGPWKLQAGRSFETKSGTFHLAYGTSKNGVADFPDFCELDANAKLIAAAPDLLEAAIIAADWLCECPEGTDQYERGQVLAKAIAKAEGRTN